MSGRAKHAGWAGLLVPLVLLLVLVGVGVYLQGLLPGADEHAEAAPPVMDLAPMDDAAEDVRPDLDEARDHSPPDVAPLEVRVVRWPDGRALDGVTVELAFASGDAESFDLARGQGLQREVPLERYPVTVTAGAPGHETRQRQLAAPGLARLELPARDGFSVRITDPLGTPHAGVTLDVWAHWVPRPTWVHERELGEAYVAWELRRRQPTAGPSNADGYVRIEPLADEHTLVDLVYAVTGAALGSDVVRVPLPHDRQRLPDAILRSVEPVEVVVVDEFGERLPEAHIELDAGPGLERRADVKRAADALGVARGPRHRGPVAVRAVLAGHDVVRVRVDGQPRAVDEHGWFPVAADERQVECVLVRDRRVIGTVVDSLSGLPAADVRAVLRGVSWRGRVEDLLETVSDASGVVDLAVPARYVEGPLELRFELLGAPPYVLTVAPESADLAQPATWFVPRLPGGELVLAGEVRGPSGRVLDATVSVWSAPPGTVSADQVVYEPQEPWRRQWHGETDEHGLFRAYLGAGADDDVVLVAVSRDDAGAVEHVARWGPRPAHEALSGRLVLSAQHELPLLLHLDRGDASRERTLVRRTWWPWAPEAHELEIPTFGRAPVGGADAPRGPRGDPTTWRDRWLDMGSAPAGSYVQFELLTAREPVDLAVDRAQWDGSALRADDHVTAARQRVELGHGEPRRITGLVGHEVPVAWGELGASLLAAPSRARRPELLGRHDAWTRVSAEGTFELLVPATAEDAPVAAMLHRWRADGRVEVFLHLQSTVARLPETWPPPGGMAFETPQVLPTLREWLDG